MSSLRSDRRASSRAGGNPGEVIGEALPAAVAFDPGMGEALGTALVPNLGRGVGQKSAVDDDREGRGRDVRGEGANTERPVGGHGVRQVEEQPGGG